MCLFVQFLASCVADLCLIGLQDVCCEHVCPQLAVNAFVAKTNFLLYLFAAAFSTYLVALLNSLNLGVLSHTQQVQDFLSLR